MIVLVITQVDVTMAAGQEVLAKQWWIVDCAVVGHVRLARLKSMNRAVNVNMQSFGCDYTSP